jgi:hypothetical protein
VVLLSKLAKRAMLSLNGRLDWALKKRMFGYNGWTKEKGTGFLARYQIFFNGPPSLGTIIS